MSCKRREQTTESFFLFSLFFEKNAPDVREVLTGAAEFVQSQVLNTRVTASESRVPAGPAGPASELC